MDTACVHSRVHDRVDGRVLRRVHGGVTAVYTVGRVHGPYTTVNTACTRPCTRIYGLYTKPIEFATFSQTLVITSVNKAKSIIACHRMFIKYGVKWDLG